MDYDTNTKTLLFHDEMSIYQEALIHHLWSNYLIIGQSSGTNSFEVEFREILIIL